MTKKEVIIDIGIALIFVSLILLIVDWYERSQESITTDFASVSIISHAIVPTSTPLPAYTGVPRLIILSVVTDQSVTVRTDNFPRDQVFVVTLGPMGSQGINGIFVGVIESGLGGTLDATFPIPEALKGSYQIAIRMQSQDAYYAYDWFYNNTTGTGGQPALTAQSPTSYPTLIPTTTPTHTPSPTPTPTTIPTIDAALWNVLTPPPTPNIIPFATTELASIEINSLPGWEIQVKYPSKMRSGGHGIITVLLSEKSPALAPIGMGGRSLDVDGDSTEYQGFSSTPFPVGTPESPIIDAYGGDSLICIKPYLRGGAFTITNFTPNNDLCSDLEQTGFGRSISWIWEITPKESSERKQFMAIFLDGEWEIGGDETERKIHTFWQQEIWVDVYVPTFQVAPLNPLEVIMAFFTLGLTFLLTAIAGPYINQRRKKGNDV